jgi:hypothetical protein
MQYLSSNVIVNGLSSVLELVKREPVIIFEEQEEVAVILSMKEYQRILANNVKDFQSFCDRVGQKAQDRGLTEEKLLEILTDV